MAFKIKISPMLLKSVASLYSDPHRVIMEYICNSIDAGEIFYDKVNKKYSKPIEIIVTFNGKSYDYARIIIQDNCTGIKNLSDLVTKVGNSSKLNEQDTNGQFGFGIYSFLAICDSLLITTRISNSNSINRVELNSKMFESPESEGMYIEEQNNISGYTLNKAREDCWTRFRLETFNKQAFKELSVKALKTEIENHFELILNRRNIIIKIIDTAQRELICESFNYDKYEGETFHREFDNLEKTKSKKFKSKVSIPIPNKWVIFLKVSKNRMLDRKPIFIIKGRRITEISNVKSFRTNSKGSIWSHPNLTGYIDVTGILEPKLSRDDFKPNILGKALFRSLIEMEGEIKEFITSQLKLPSSKEYRNLEDYLSKTLNKLNNDKKFRNLLNFETGSNKRVSREKPEIKVIDKITLSVPKRVLNPNGTIFENRKRLDLLEEEEIDKNNPIEDYTNASSLGMNKEIVMKDVVVKLSSEARDIVCIDKKEFNQTKGNFGGFGIAIDCDNKPPLDSNNKRLRSSMINNQIIIYKKHPMFEERTRGNYLGVQTISIELIFYISVEIITQIKILVFNENKKSIEDIGAFFHSFNEGVYLFISELSKLAGKNLSELAAIKEV